MLKILPHTTANWDMCTIIIHPLLRVSCQFYIGYYISLRLGEEIVGEVDLSTCLGCPALPALEMIFLRKRICLMGNLLYNSKCPALKGCIRRATAEDARRTEPWVRETKENKPS
jgi:hypothetical protein